MEKKQKDELAAILKNIEATKDELDNAAGRAAGEVEDIITRVDALKDTLQEKFDDMSEKIQEGDKGSALQEEVGELESLSDELDTLKGELEDSSPFDDVVNTFKGIIDK
jgi:DNA repair exonuclease SbcCD ATPase subunit